MSADFWSGYASGAIGILVGNPLDIIKTQLQAGSKPTLQTTPTSTSTNAPRTWSSHLDRLTSLARGATAPILGYGALNALLFVTYNRSLALLNSQSPSAPAPENPSGWSIWTAGALGGIATFFVSAPTELVKCRAQVSEPARSSVEVARELWAAGGTRAMFLGGAVTSARDGVGYGFYFWSYHLSKQAMTVEDESARQQAVKVMLCGGLAGVVTWASVFPLDVIKTRVQTWDLVSSSRPPPSASDTAPLLQREQSSTAKNPTARPSTLHIAREAYRREGLAVFFNGLGICSARAFIVNAVQWAVYEWMMGVLVP